MINFAISRLDRSLAILALVFLAVCSSSSVAQVNGPGVSDPNDFGTVISLPGDTPQIFGFRSFSDTQINVSDGGLTTGGVQTFNSGTEVNVSGGILGTFIANDNTEINFSGGLLSGQGGDFNSGSILNFSGGSTAGLIEAFDGSVINISDGNFGPAFNSSLRANAGSQLNISGGTFEGFVTITNDSRVDISDGDFNSLFNVGNGSVVSISNGDFEILDANAGSLVNISGGNFDSFDTNNGSEVNIIDGTFGDDTDPSHTFEAFEGSTVNIDGGIFSGELRADGLVNIAGGTFNEQLRTRDGGVVNITGGSFQGRFFATNGSEVNLVGSEFRLDGKQIEGLEESDTALINQRDDAILSGVLLDGSNFSVVLDDFGSSGEDFVSNQATITVTVVVPEPSTFGLLSLGFSSCLLRRSRRNG